MLRWRLIRWLVISVAVVMMTACGGGGDNPVLNPEVAKIVNWAENGGTAPTAEDYAAAGVDLNGHSSDEINRYIQQYYAEHGSSGVFDSDAELNRIAEDLGVTILDTDGDGIYDAFDSTPNGENGDGDSDSDGDGDGNASIISNSGIYVAESIKVEGNKIRSYNGLYPLIHNSRIYIYHTTVKEIDIDGVTNRDIDLSVKSYDISGFNMDMNMSDLPTNILYQKSTIVNRLNTYDFPVVHHNIVKRDNYLYFSTSPDTVESKTQGSLIKYDLNAQARVYHAKNDAINGYVDDIDRGSYFDLTRGWFVPFDDEHIGVVSGHTSKVVNSDDGSPLVIGLPYFSGPGMQENNYMYGSPVSNHERYFHIERDTPAGYNGLLNVKYIADNAGGDKVKLGNRDIYNPGQESCRSYDLACRYKNPNYKFTRFLDDFKAKYTGSKKYVYTNNEWYFVAQNQNMFLDDDRLYVPVQIQIDSNTSSNQDAYIMEYDMDSNLVALHYIDGTNRTARYGLAPSFYNFTKHGDIIYYIGEDDERRKLLVAYNMRTKSFVFKKDITQQQSMNFGDYVPQEYILTGSTIIIPHKRVQSNDYYYDMVFDVLDVADGHTIKRLQHDKLKGLHHGYSISYQGAVSDSDSVYYVLKKTMSDDNKYRRTLIVKIDSPNNTVQKEQYRYDTYMSGVAKSQ